ncbi:hypothetical protein SF1_19190 [Sphingobacterium faecium NBRC 15299]|uniref:hypothetical protein n=1 Tax=Sphingobacterium faecium TaxID=34087 RepID=UPI000D35A630|nr:hypothetical protein [Sphingobacterium faecium]PTX09436.1 hypothetical protein C8N37_10664 [Sphingobacterium faecium]GEM63937.1 hypothetical protein SF1_19190 [Sphingobacterium faecium NBRC 15299]
MANLKITLKLLEFFQEKGYQAILLRHGQDTYIPVFEDLYELTEKISMIPLQEDQVISISDAIDLFDELELADKEIINVFEND